MFKEIAPNDSSFGSIEIWISDCSVKGGQSFTSTLLEGSSEDERLTVRNEKGKLRRYYGFDSW